MQKIGVLLSNNYGIHLTVFRYSWVVALKTRSS